MICSISMHTILLFLTHTNYFFQEKALDPGTKSNTYTTCSKSEKPGLPSEISATTSPRHNFQVEYMIIIAGLDPTTFSLLNKLPASSYEYLVIKRKWLLKKIKSNNENQNPKAHQLCEYINFLWDSSKQKIITQESLIPPLYSLICEYLPPYNYGILEKLDQLIALDNEVQ